MNAPDPVDELRKIALIGVAATAKCPHCYMRSAMHHDEHGYAVEHFHEAECPEHEDNQPAAEAPL